ncbi:hypothetical protein VNO78_23513 [Psophocarpus tetragonolobus]|uniref:Uncharacterized protein n=1 Tax=Psophocarpus tetragonolobus TaxID=3891 RepID=A0AAN9S3N7_PSOTE
MISAQGVAVATAMAVSGTVIILALRLQKCFPTSELSDDEIPCSGAPILRSCISNGGKKSKKKKRVHFAEDVVESCGDGEEFRKRLSRSKLHKSFNNGGMPPNRAALYNGILRNRLAQRLAYSC